MNEDERYRSSTQYRLWSFTSESLASQRVTTNRIASERVKTAIQRSRASRATSTSASGEASEAEQNCSVSRATSLGSDAEVDCLTPEEELKLVSFFCLQTLQAGDHLKVPTDVKATAIQYIKRFYITNSVMTYHPTDIVKTALFFATKTENHYFRLTKFAEAIGKTTPDDVLASEFLLTQGLRFTFDVRHPFRALEGAVMELQAIVNSNDSIPPFPGAERIQAPKELGNMTRRLRDAHGKAREYLKTSALLSDAYFHYTPSQIMSAALHIADPDLTEWYISSKFPLTENGIDPALPRLDNVLATISACASVLLTVSPTAQPSDAELKEMRQLAKKLQKCRNPEKIDLVALNKKAKREGMEEGVLDERALKKRKLQKERLAKEAEDLFGPTLPKKQ